MLLSEERDRFKSRRSFLVGGTITFGISYYVTLLMTSFGFTRNNRGASDYAAGFVPVVGPFIGGVLRAIPEKNQDADMTGATAFFALGAVQTVGAALFIHSLRMPQGISPDECFQPATAEGSPSAVPRPCRGVSASLAPIVTPNFAGAGITGSF